MNSTCCIITYVILNKINKIINDFLSNIIHILYIKKVKVKTTTTTNNNNIIIIIYFEYDIINNTITNITSIS